MKSEVKKKLREDRDNVMGRKRWMSDSVCHADRFSDGVEMEESGCGGQELEPNLMAYTAASSEVNQPINPCADVPGQGLARSPASG